MDIRDELIEELGYTICPICFSGYVFCDQKCEKCEEYINFKKYYEKKGCKQ